MSAGKHPGPERLGAFSDGVLAIITVMVLELHAPREPTPHALLAIWPTAMAYLYAANFLCTSAAFIAFEHQVAAQLDTSDRLLALARQRSSRRNWATLSLYAAASAVALLSPSASLVLVLASALLYLVPNVFPTRGSQDA